MARKPTTATMQPAAPKPRCNRCTNDAAIKRNGENICLACDKADRTAEAKEYCNAHGIHSKDDAMEWFRQHGILQRKFGGAR